MNKFFTFNYFYHTYMVLYCLKNANVAIHAHAEIQGSVYFFLHQLTATLSVSHYGQPRLQEEALGVDFTIDFTTKLSYLTPQCSAFRMTIICLKPRFFLALWGRGAWMHTYDGYLKFYFRPKNT